MDQPTFSVDQETRNGIARLVVNGELDMLTSPILVHEFSLTEQQPELSAILLDLREVTFMDSTGLKVFLDASLRSRNRNRHLLLVGVRPALRRVFDITGTTQLLDHAEAVSIFTEFCRDSVPAIDPHSMLAEVVNYE